MMPPLDVHWVWHVHMLAPRAYINDLKTTGILNYKPESVVSLKAKRDATATIWAEEYGSGTTRTYFLWLSVAAIFWSF